MLKKIILFMIISFSCFASDWPVYKGNLYFTGNNDEIIVKNNNLKWLFQAGSYVYNPIVSSGRVYFTDLNKIVYCLDEELGKLLWKLDLKQYSAQFRSSSKAVAAGKVKYPLIFGNNLYISDSTAIYCIDKIRGNIIWARVGAQETSAVNAVIDGIYSDPMISGNHVYYGTRKLFLARDLFSGHLSWSNSGISSYGGFPSYYDNIVFMQTKDLKKRKFFVYCLDSKTGSQKWAAELPNPMQIFSPVVYQKKVYIPIEKSLHCLDLETGKKLWSAEYEDLITTNPSFTDREILFSVANRKIVSVSPETGKITRELDFGFQASPLFVTVQDQIYIASNFSRENVSGVTFASLKAFQMGVNEKIWEFTPPFPGGVSQPAASGGVLFLPAGNYLYAVGVYYDSKIIDGGDGHYKIPQEKLPAQDQVKKTDLGAADHADQKKVGKDGEKEIKKPDPIVKTRKIKVSIVDKNLQPLPGLLLVKKQVNGKILFSRSYLINQKDQEIEVIDSDVVDLLASADGYAPKKERLYGNEDRKVIMLDRIEKGESFNVSSIYFELNKAYLKKESLDILDSIVVQLKRNNGIKLEIRGHTDSSGQRDYNQILSEKRANAVMEYMIKNGISPERLKSVGFGEKKPVADNKTELGRAQNRRTEFLVIEK